MLELTFGEQVKIVLNRKDMTIKQLAEMIEERTGKKMSRQNLTQRLARDNFQEQDMRLIASILECPFHLSILEENADSEYTTRENIKIDKRAENNIIIDEEPQQLTLNLEYDEPEQVQEEQPVKAREFGISGAERDITIGELVDIHKDLDQMEETSEYADQTEYEEPAEYEEPEEYQEAEEYQESEPYQEEEQAYEEYVEENQQDMEEEFADTAQDWEAPEEENVGDINPYTGMEYESNSVRMHPKRIGYVQVYDRSDHQWTDMTEWAFLGYQERKKALLGKDYEPPIYLD